MARPTFLTAAQAVTLLTGWQEMWEKVLSLSKNWLFAQRVLRGVEEYNIGDALSSSDGFLRGRSLNASSRRHFDEISDVSLQFSLSPSHFVELARPVCAASHTPTSSCIRCYFLSLSCFHQGAEAPNDAATQRAQVPDTWLHRVSEAEDCLLWPQVATGGASEGGEERREEGRKGTHVLSYKKKKPILTPTLRSGHLRLLCGLLPKYGWAAAP